MRINYNIIVFVMSLFFLVDALYNNAFGQVIKIDAETAFPSEGQINEDPWGNYLIWGDWYGRKIRLGVANDNYSRAEIVLVNNNLSNGTIFFKTASADGGAMTRMILDPNGNVGIGTISPSQKLEVNGTIKTKEVNVTATGWADYVFKTDYDLMPLSEVEKYISEKGHLPNVPSEKEVLENGVNLLEMNFKLLEKVEELTIYLLNQQKEIEELKTALNNKN